MSSSPTETGALLDVSMPQMGVSVAEGTVVAWLVEIGASVTADQTVCEIETDKIATDVPAPAAGMIAEILVEAGATVDVGTVLARIAPASRPGEASRAATARHGSPVVQRIAAQHGIDLADVRGTGRGGRVRKQDVLALVQANGAPAEPPLHSESPYRPEPAQDTAADRAGGAPQTLSRMRQTIGAHMKRSLETAATCTTWMEADMTRVEAARARGRASGLMAVTALPIVARCTIEALREMPALNATLERDRYEQHADVNLGIAVSLGEDGLIVPVIQRAQELSVEQLGARIKELAQRARAGALVPDEVRGATFTITNPGGYGSLMATPIINQPQVAILDLEAIVKRPVVVTGDDGSDMIAIRPQTILGLSWDHRALDGALAARFLGAVRRRLEAWEGE